MTLSSPSLRRFVRRALVDAAGAGPLGPTQLAAAFDALCGRLHRQLLPLFGTTGVDALFERAVHVAAREFPWLGELVRNGKDPCVADRIGALGEIEVNTLEEALASVLAHNIGLLNTFVGEDLVLPLVQQAWGVIDGPKAESKP